MAEYGNPSPQPTTTPAPTPKPTPASRSISQTKSAHALDLYKQARYGVSFSGELCKVTGVLGAALGALLTVASVASGSGAAFLVSGTATVALAMAGAPIAAIGSMATQAKRQTKFAELDAWLKKENY